MGVSKTHAAIVRPSKIRPSESFGTLAASITESSLRYSMAFSSKSPQRDTQSASASPSSLYNASKSQPDLHIGVKEPYRMNATFRSDVPRFPKGGGFGGPGRMHPSSVMPASSFAVDKDPNLAYDQAHWKSKGFFHPRTPQRPPVPSPSTTSTLESPVGGPHADGMYISLQQAVLYSPKRLRSMSSQTKRFATPQTYRASDSRFLNCRLGDPYDTALGPGSYEAFSASSFAPSGQAADDAVVERRSMVSYPKGSPSLTAGFSPSKPRPSPHPLGFESRTPRLKNLDRLPATVGGSTSSVALDQASWDAPSSQTSMPRATSGRSTLVTIPGPQPGSFEHMEGIGRAESPKLRGPQPDVTYNTEASPQKRSLALEVAHSPLRFAASFASGVARIPPSPAEKRTCEYSWHPDEISDPFDLSVSASRTSLGLLSRSQSAKL